MHENIMCVGMQLLTDNCDNKEMLLELLLCTEKSQKVNVKNGYVNAQPGINILGDVNYIEKYKILLDYVINGAIKDSNINFTVYDKTRIGLVVGTSLGNIAHLEQHITAMESEQDSYTLDYETMRTAIKYNIGGACFTVSNTCTSGINAISVASTLFKNNSVDICIVVGCDIVSDFILDGFGASHILSKNNKFEIFTKDRDGIVLSDGAGAMVLVNDTKVKVKYQNMYGSIAGCNIANDAEHLVAPSKEGSGMCLAIKNSLSQAHLELNDIDCVFVGANGTKYNDLMYGTVINKIWKDRITTIPVVSIKHFIGHTLGASSIVETISILMLMKENTLPPISSYEKLDEEFKNLNIVKQHMKNRMDNVIILSNGFSGVNGALIIREGRK